ncbi:MmpS family transport accessory protein [Streptomyces sp. NPDC059002]|uniref:MmpS family transport accessory protein n=1 Tax=Streptomyces sp. NPDC059002 TaxID=3346690 RepID=UPI003695BF02
MSQPPVYPPQGGPQGWATPPPVPPQGKKRRKWPWVLLGVLILLVGGCTALVVGIGYEVDKESKREVTVEYEVTGDAKGVAIAYTAYGDGNLSQNQLSDVELPWSKKQKTKGFVKGGALAVTMGASGGSVRCKVTVDGATRTATASGAFATAVCDGF